MAVRIGIDVRDDVLLLTSWMCTCSCGAVGICLNKAELKKELPRSLKMVADITQIFLAASGFGDSKSSAMSAVISFGTL